MADDDWVLATPTTEPTARIVVRPSDKPSDKWVPEGQRTWQGVQTVEDLPQIADDTVRAAGNAVSFGMADRLAAGGNAALGVGDVHSYEDSLKAELLKSQQARERSPIASAVGTAVGSALVPSRVAAALASRLATYGGRLAGWGGRAAAYGAEGAAIGGAQGAGNTYTGNPADYAKNAAKAAVMGGVLGGVTGAAVGPRPLVSAARAPTAAEQETAKTAAYGVLERHPARYTPESTSGRAYAIENDLRMGRNAHETTSPQSFRTVNQLHYPPTAAATGRQYITPGDLDFVRKGVAGNEVKGLTPTDAGNASVVRRGIDDFIRNPPPGAAVPGTEHLAANAAQVANIAHQQHGAFKRTQAIEELIENAGRQAGSTYSGLNLRNELQKAVKSGLKEKDGTSAFSKAGYDAAERAAFDKFSRGQGAVSRGLGYVDKYLGGGGGLGALAAGVAGGHYLDENNGLAYGLGTSAAGLGLRLYGNRRAAANIDALRDTIAQRSPLYQYRAATSPMVRGGGLSDGSTQTLRDAITLQLLEREKQE